jgi:hypothetical protein
MRFYEMQILRQIFTGEEKETYAFACRHLAAEGDKPHDFWQIKFSPAWNSRFYNGTETSCIGPTNSADFCAGRPASLPDAMFTS